MSLRTSITNWTRDILKKSWSSSQIIDEVPTQRLNKLIGSVYGYPVSTSTSQLPPGYHFVYHNPNLNNLGNDGYDNYQAPVDVANLGLFKRRMWVGGKIDFILPIHYNSNIECVEIVKGVRFLEGTCFVNIERKFQENGAVSLIESRTLAYSNSKYKIPNEPKILEIPDKSLSTGIVLTQIQNFRYSALTYNAHKIHYDLDYCQQEEGFPNVLISGPFAITLLINWFSANHPSMKIRSVKYKNKLPIYQGDKLEFTCKEKARGEYAIRILNLRGTLVEGVIQVDCIN